MGLRQGEMARGPGWGPKEDTTVGRRELAGAQVVLSRSCKQTGSWQPSLGGASTTHCATQKGD